MSLQKLYEVIRNLYGAERGELLIAFLMAHSITTNQKPSLENSKALTETTDEYKRDYLITHFSKPDEIIRVVININSSENKEILTPYLRQYSKIMNKEFIIWSHLTHTIAPFSHPDRFGDDNFPLSIIEPFKNKQPFLLNNNVVFKEKVDIAYLPQIILDSNILQYVDWYVNDPAKLRENIPYVENMLRYFVSHDYLYSPYFYYFEATSKGSKREHLISPFSLLVRMQCMNKDAMLTSGVFHFDDEKFIKLKNNLNASDFDDLVNISIDISDKFAKEFSEQTLLVDLFYCVITKTVLIEKNSKASNLSNKIELLLEFLENTIKAQFSYEFILAICYFSGKFQKFLNIQQTMKYNDANKYLLACAWDLLILRQPELFLAGGQQDFTVISS